MYQEAKTKEEYMIYVYSCLNSSLTPLDIKIIPTHSQGDI